MRGIIVGWKKASVPNAPTALGTVATRGDCLEVEPLGLWEVMQGQPILSEKS